jgi:4-amino-4-deoxy-L-arabinose transferase-like glycosyltransferase
MTSRTGSLAIVLLVWAAIYLPGLGSLAIKGEEGRRILPAVSMLRTGNYLVPRVGGETYFSKPPLVNWLVAGSFKLFGKRNEWTARLPSALCVLAVALAFATLTRRGSLGPRGSTVAAVIWLTSAGIVEKGRLIEIEALYVSLCALAIIFWVSFWERKKSAWLIWIPASIFLGLGWLAKGPLHLVFFYGVVIAIVWQNRNWRLLFGPAHLVAVLVMLGIFAAWAVPFAEAAGGARAAAKWSFQFTGRLGGHDFVFFHWIGNMPKGLVYFLPWTVLLPLVRFDMFAGEQERRLARGLAWGAIVPFVAVNLAPGSLPRYAMPALVPACWLLAMTLCAENARWPGWLGGKSFSLKNRLRAVAALAILACLCMGAYGAAIIPRLHSRQNVKRFAAQIDAIVPHSKPLYALNPDYQPIFFYVHSTLVYVERMDELPADAVYLLVRPKKEEAVLGSSRWAPRHARAVLRATDYRGQSIVLMKIE